MRSFKPDAIQFANMCRMGLSVAAVSRRLAVSAEGRTGGYLLSRTHNRIPAKGCGWCDYCMECKE